MAAGGQAFIPHKDPIMRTFTSSFHKTRKLRFLQENMSATGFAAFHSGTIKIHAPLKSVRPYFSCSNTNT